MHKYACAIMLILTIDILAQVCYYIITAREQTKTAKTPATVDAKNTYKSGSGCGRLRRTDKNATPQRPPAAGVPLNRNRRYRK